MILKSFRVRNYRSINDSGDIVVSRITALLGRNESGKSNLLRGLHCMNPIDGFKALNPIKDFPRDRRMEECSDDTEVVTTTWELEEDDKVDLLDIFPRAVDVKTLEVRRKYQGANRYISFPELKPIAFDEADTKGKVKKVAAAIRALAAKAAEGNTLEATADTFEEKASVTKVRDSWAVEFVSSAKTVRTALAGADVDLSQAQDALLADLEELSVLISGDKDVQQKARTWAISAIPKFFYLDDYPELSGHQDIAAYLQRKAQNQLSDADKNFEKLCKVAGLNPEKLKILTNQEKAQYLLPMVGGDTISARMKASFMELGETITTWPQLASAVALGGALATDVSRRILLNQLQVSGKIQHTRI